MGHCTADKGEPTLAESLEGGKVGGREGNDGRTRMGGKKGGEGDREKKRRQG